MTTTLAFFFEGPAAVLNWLYTATGSYLVAISLTAVIVMAIVTPLTLKSTKGMLEMQRLAPEMRRLQTEYRSDRQKLNEEMMKLYQEHKVNPMASCLPLLAQMPVFIVMFRILHDATRTNRQWVLQRSSQLHTHWIIRSEHSYSFKVAHHPLNPNCLK